MQVQAQAPLLQAPIPTFPWIAHVNRHPDVQAFESHVGGAVVQLPPMQVEPAPQSALVQHAKEQTQLLPCLV